MRNPYQVLGIAKNASESEIKKAYRKLAKILHPDHNKDDPKAKDKFAELSAAYELLSDPQKKQQYDNGEIDENGNPKNYGPSQDAFWKQTQQGYGGFHADSRNPFEGGGFRYQSRSSGSASDDDIFSQFFGGFRKGSDDFQQRRSPDIEMSLSLTLEQIASEDKIPLNIPGGRRIEVGIPHDLKDGQIVRLKGLAPLNNYTSSGDILLKILIKPHSRYKVEGSNIRSSLPISIDNAVLGATVRVPTLRGDIEVTLPPNTDSGKTLRIRSKGLPTKNGYGDHYVVTQIKLPKGTDEDLVAYAKKKRG